VVVKGDDGRYYKPCSSCGTLQSYLRRNYAEESAKLNKLCKACANKLPENNAHKGFYLEVLRASFVHKYKNGAETRNIVWDVSFEYLAELLIEQDFRCALSGIPISAMEVNNNASLDRINSDLGYIEGNVQWVTAKVNMMKHHYTKEEFLEICLNVANFHARLNGR
jgi:hypothetical protein